MSSWGIRPTPGVCRANRNLWYMFYVYILLSSKDKKFYIGATTDLKFRKSQHDKGMVESTRARRPLVLMCYEAYPTKSEALAREKYLKTSDGRKELKIRLKTTLAKYQI